MKPKVILPEHQQLLKELGNRIKQYRIEKGIGYIEMAEEIGISRNAYNLLENGKIYFSFSTLLKVLSFHKIEISDFFKDL